jgi:hypothetical protein
LGAADLQSRDRRHLVGQLPRGAFDRTGRRRAHGPAEELQGPLGIGHRDVVPVDPSHGERLVRGFDALDGWETWRSVYMVRARESDREDGGAKEVPRSSVEVVRRAVAEHDPEFTPEAVEQTLVRDARFDFVGNGRWFAAPPDGAPGGPRACSTSEMASGRWRRWLRCPTAGTGPGERRGDGGGECLTGGGA